MKPIIKNAKDREAVRRRISSILKSEREDYNAAGGQGLSAYAIGGGISMALTLRSRLCGPAPKAAKRKARKR